MSRRLANLRIAVEILLNCSGFTGHFITAGGRVLGVTATGDDLAEALRRCYQAVNDISRNGMQYRRDIGR